MSNHTGSYMLNDIIQMLNDEQVLEAIGLQKTQQVITKLIQIATREYDCNAGEILEGHTDRLHLCYCMVLESDRNCSRGDRSHYSICGVADWWDEFVCGGAAATHKFIPD